MKKQLLNRQDQDRQIAEMWDAVNLISDEDLGRQEAVEMALDTQKKIYQQLDLQDKVLAAIWNAVHIVNPENPLAAALSISANAERLIPVLKSYSDPIIATGDQVNGLPIIIVEQSKL